MLESTPSPHIPQMGDFGKQFQGAVPGFDF
jgi:hypothetical protein